MTRKDLFKTLFPEVDTEPDNCLGIACNNPRGCNECTYKNYWNEPATLSKIAVKSILNSTYGCNALYGTLGPLLYNDTDSLKVVHDVYHAGKTNVEECLLAYQGWTKFPSLHNNIDWAMLKDIIDDALDNGFEVKILNGTIYYREKQ